MSKVRAEQYTNRAGSGAPEIPYGVTVPSGASIDGAGGLNLTGIATAGSFKGNLTGDVSGNVTGLAATFTGPVTIGGTLTYEDVTNIDSVGVITARDGIVATGVVTATSFSGSGANLTGIEAAPTIQAVASGSISADESVILTPDGKVKVVTNVTQSVGNKVSASGGQASTNLTNCAYSPTSNKVVVVYRSSSVGRAVVGTVSGTSITFGTPVQFATNVHDDSTSLLDITWGDSSNDTFLLSWKSPVDDKIHGCVLTGISGTVPSFSSVFVISSVVGGYPVSAYSTARSRWLVAYSAYSSNRGYIRSVSWNGSSQGIGGEYTFVSGNMSQIDMCYDSNADRFVALFRYSADSNKLTSVVIKIETNGALSFGQDRAVMDPTVAMAPGIMYDAVTQNVVGVYQNESISNKLYGIVGKVNTNTEKVTWNDHLSLTTTAINTSISYRTPIMYDPVSARIIIFYGDSSNKLYMMLARINADGTGVESMSTTVIQSSGSDIQGYWFDSCMDTTADRAVLSYWNGDGGSTGGCDVQIIRPPSTDITEDNFIGFSKAAYTDGQTATVKVVGNTTTQSGLTTAKRYYVQNDGSLATTAQTPNIFAGRAISATSVLIQ